MIVSLALAFAAGLLTFFAACLLPVIPAYFSYLASLALRTKEGPESKFYQRRVLINSLLFVLGFLLIFTLLGLGASILGQWLAVNRLWLRGIGAIFLVVLGINLLEVIKFPWLHKSWSLKVPQPTRWHNLTALVFGITFGLAWTPCIGPTLAIILLLASQSATIAQGTVLLIVFGLGLGLPFILIGSVFQRAADYLPHLAKWTRLIKIISGSVIIIIGLLLLFNKLGSLSQWFLKLGGSLVIFGQRPTSLWLGSFDL